MIKAVIFDCFGVLVTDGWYPFKRKYFKDDKEKNAEASRLNNLTNKGLLSHQEFLQMIGDMSDITVNEVNKELNKNALNKEVIEFIKSIKSEYKIGILSNAADNWLDSLLGTENLDLFNVAVLSCDIFVNKPDPKAYQITAEKLGCEMSECLFVDDIASYVEAAREAGMQAVHYRDPEQAIREITSYF